MKKEIILPVGRMVQGDAFKPSLTDQQGNPRVFKSGPRIGQPNPQYFVAIAYSKQDPEFYKVQAALVEVARASFPHLFDAAGNCVNPMFAWKLVDGDGIDTSGKPNNTKDGFAGHWVLRLSSGFAPKIYIKGKYDPSQEVKDERELPRGYYIRALIDVAGNDNVQKPGLYLNLKMIEIDKPGPVISNGPDASAVFAATASPGAYTGAPVSGMPAMGAPMMPPAAPAIVAPPAAMMPPMAAPAAMAPPMVVAPAPHMVAVTPPAPVMAPPVPVPPAAPVRQMTALAQGATYEALIAAGWNDALLIERGLMLP